MTQTKEAIDSLSQWYGKEELRIMKEFFDFLRFQSISAEKEFKGQVLACADFVQNYLKSLGFEVERWETVGYPTLFARSADFDPDKPTVLIYNHYDVQPVDPLEEWDSAPFEPEIRDGEVYARGAQDNKGQCFYSLQAIRALMEVKGKLPVNLKLCIEGEEEKGSEGISKILAEKASELKADYLVVADVGIRAPDKPAITLGVRGMAAMSVEVEGPNSDLHSGAHGGMVYNPNHALVKILASLHDENGRVTVPGFYDGVEEPSPEMLAAFSFEGTEEEYEALVGVPPTGGEKAYPFLQRGTIRPTIEINGVGGGYSGSGFKTVIPAKAMAKVSCRLVPGQDPDRINRLVGDFICGQAPKGIKVRVQRHHGGQAARGSTDSLAAEAFRQAYTEVFGTPCQMILEGGSIPVIADMNHYVQGELVLMGLGLPDDQIHAPNEHFGVDRFRKGFLIMARALELMGEGKTL